MRRGKDGDKRVMQSKERNEKMASILTFLITITNKIQKIKQKICGFSPISFSPESIFEALDLTSKGSLQLHDIRAFLQNDNIKDQTIELLIGRLDENDRGIAKLTYLGYLNLLKPYFNYDLGRDLLLRDTISRKMRDPSSISQQKLHQMQQTVLMLLNELILLNCISISEHQDMKSTLLDEYMLNTIQIAQILGFTDKVAPLKAIYQFIQCNSDYDVEEEQVKYLLAFAQTNQQNISQDQCLSRIFLPSRNTFKAASNTIQTNREKQIMHTNYNKNYIGKNDLITNVNKLTFLNYVHPNSFQKMKQQQQGQKYKRKPTAKESSIAEQHNKLSIINSKYMKNSITNLKKKQFNLHQDRDLDQSVIQGSNIYKSKLPTKNIHSYAHLQQSDYRPLETPILQQFMRESNIRRNLGQARGINKSNQLNVLLQEASDSALSNSDAIVMVNPSNQRQRETSNKKQANLINKYSKEYGSKSKHKNSQKNESPLIYAHINKRFENESMDGSNLLNQFIRH